MLIFGKLAKLPLCYKRYVLTHPGLHLPIKLRHIVVGIYITVQLKPSYSVVCYSVITRVRSL